MGFSRQECWSGLPFPTPGDLPDAGIEPGSPALQVDFLLSHKGSPYSLHRVLSTLELKFEPPVPQNVTILADTNF